jgi:hypothetical protein
VALDEPTQKWVIQFQGGPWGGNSMLVERDPGKVIDVPTDPPIRYLLSVKLGPVQDGRPERLVFKIEHPDPNEKTSNSN